MEFRCETVFINAGNVEPRAKKIEFPGMWNIFEHESTISRLISRLIFRIKKYPLRDLNLYNFIYELYESL